jgi:uncharacterized membrane protein YozB (DUF420 family)
MITGTFRVVQLSGGGPITPDNARFFAAPLPLVLHIVSAVVYSVLGAFQFVPSLRRRTLRWHRVAGRVLIPCGLMVALTGLWMTQFYPRAMEPPASFDGPVLYDIRLLAGSAMALALCLGFFAVHKRDIAHHRAWMMRQLEYRASLGLVT